MPSNLKKLVRARMAKTGETWQVALRHVRSQVQDLAGGGSTAPGENPSAPPADAYPSSHYDEERVWFPLRRDGSWLNEADWERNLRVLRVRSDGRRALTALAGVFTPAWSREQCGTHGVHPVVYDHITIGGRHKLLEVGSMLATMPEKKRLRERLQPKNEYHGTCAELRGGLLLRSAGATVAWEPIKDRSGPDWLARWPSGALVAEVKGPLESRRTLARQRVLTEFFFAFMQYANDPLPGVDAGIWLTLEPSQAVLESKTVLGAPDMAAVDALAREAAAAVRRNLPLPNVAGRFSAGAAGDFSVALGLGHEPRVQFAMRGADAGHEHDGLRLFETIQEAAQQLRAVEETVHLKGTPGLVIIDAEANFTILNHLDDVHESLRTESWARGLAAVAIVTRSTSGDEEFGDLRSDTSVRIVPGPRVSLLEATLLAGMRVCEREHFHVDTMMAAAKECQLAW